MLSDCYYPEKGKFSFIEQEQSSSNIDKDNNLNMLSDCYYPEKKVVMIVIQLYMNILYLLSHPISPSPLTIKLVKLF